MNKLLEAVMAEFHGALAGLHGFAAKFFYRRKRYGWFAFHAIASIVSVICSLVHKRDARSTKKGRSS